MSAGRFCWYTTIPVYSPLSVAASLQGQSGVVARETIWPQSPKYLLSDLLHKQYADPCSRVELSDASHPEASWKLVTFGQWTVIRGWCPAGLGLGERCLTAPEILVQRLARGFNPTCGCSIWTLTWACSSAASGTFLVTQRFPVTTSLLTKVFMIYKCFSLLLLYFCLCSQALGLPFIIHLNWPFLKVLRAGRKALLRIS